jgi:DNA-directed RNA polymerase subunit M/transcription elongation factor TFIIS
MPKKNVCPKCGGSMWSYIRNGKYVGRCGNCGYDTEMAKKEESAEPVYPKKLRWDPALMEDPVVEAPVTEPEPEVIEPVVVEEVVVPAVDTGLPEPEALVREEPAVVEPEVEVIEEVAEDTVDASGDEPEVTE